MITPGKKEGEEMPNKNQTKKEPGTNRRNSSLAEQHGEKPPFDSFPSIEETGGIIKPWSLKGSIGQPSLFISADLFTRHMMVSGRKDTAKTCFKKVVLKQLLHSPIAKK